MSDLDVGAKILDDVEVFLAEFVAYPSEVARVAHALWIAHTHLMPCWESTPRIAFLSPEPGSGKTRALEVTEPLVPRPVLAVNATPAYLFRKVTDPAGLPTILFDEIDTLFGPKSKEHEDVRGMLNAGHRKGAIAGRCVIRGKTVETEELPAYCAVALAGLDDLPDTLMSRAVVVRMRKRAGTEYVRPWREREQRDRCFFLREDLAAWAANVADSVTGSWPAMPDGIEDRNADVWEPLLAVADAAGGAWPNRARDAAVRLVNDPGGKAPSLGVRLLADVYAIFSAASMPSGLPSEYLVDELNKLEEAPWSSFRKGAGLDRSGLALRLRRYEVSSVQVWHDGRNLRGYRSADLDDPWSRYLPPPAIGYPDAARTARHARPQVSESTETLFSSVPSGSSEATGAIPTRECAACARPAGGDGFCGTDDELHADARRILGSTT